MANIQNLTEAWAGHTGLEVESFLKSQLTALAASVGGKFGYVAFNPQTMTVSFYDEPGGTVLGSVQLGGQIYTISIDSNLSQVFYVLADEATKMMTITPSTTVSSFGSSTQEPFPESYTYVVAVNSGSGYVDRVTGSISTGGSATFDVKPFLATGDNYIRVAVTGTSSGQTKTSVFTGTLTTLTMSCNHMWQNVWTQGQDYVVTGIRFAGNLVKQLHVSLDNVELTPITYSASQSYTTTATFYTIPTASFPAGGSAVHSVKLWMSAQGVSTPVVSYNIMCAASGDNTPLVAINAIADRAYNFTSGTIFSYAVYNANKVSIDMSATLNSVNYVVATGVVATERETGTQYPFAYSLEVDTGANETKIGSLAIAVMPYFNETHPQNAQTASTIFDNTYSYLATPDYLFYLNAATRDNGTDDHETIINDAGESANFAATYSATWSGLSWYNDGWSTDPSGYKALCIPAGCSVTIPNLTPLSLMSSYPGMTVEFMLQCGSPSDYSEPVLSLSSGGTTPVGILIYPTKITVWGSAERDQDYQTVNFSENTMTHICITFLKGYEGQSGKNICSVYVNGISNVNFAFDGASSFGNGSLTIGQAHTDAYLYKMRVYGSALESGAVLNNFLNCIVDGVDFNRSVVNAKNDVLLGEAVDYELVKRAGFNTMVITTPNNAAIPSFFNKVEIAGCTVRFEYAGQSVKNATVSNLTMDGQGTTSKKYYRWNLRWKTGSTTTWTYGDGTTTANSKVGRMINDTNYIEVDRITAKKNIASSPQGHKMGLTGLYNDLFHQIGLNAELPDSSYRVAVYQFPFIGFHYNTTNNQYEFIGVYTCGPDKGSKKTFGYSSSFPNLLSIEGPNHAPRGTRFLCPWVDVAYDPDEETLTFGGEEGWDADFVNYETSRDKGTQSDWDNILALYNAEWQPAYNCVYDNSPYLASYQEVINDLHNANVTTLADLLTVGNAAAIKEGKTNNMIVKNEFIAFYDSSYDLYFYRRSTGKYEKLPSTYAGKKNALTDLTAYLSALGYSTSSPTTAQLIEARGARFKSTMGNFFSVNQTIYHYCFCLLFGVTDNYAKNSYPFKFQALSTSGVGNRWGWRQDDLDSVLMTDNNGTNTKSYSVEHLDTFDGVQIFQGGDAALWMLIKANYEDECRAMMGQIASAATALATALGIAGSGEHESLFNLTAYHCWDHSAKYFPATIYESDRRWSYIEPWLLAGSTIPGTSETYPELYNGVAPLTQALGDQYQGEKLWMYRRIAYIFSKYHIGAFHGTATGYNAIVFTLAQSFTFQLTPAIDLYPVTSLVDDDTVGTRTPAGTSVSLYTPSDGTSNNSIHGGDWLASLGDLHLMRLTNRGGSSSIPFSVTGARLQTLKIGDATPWDASTTGFNATVFGVTSPTLVTLDARNTTTIGNTVDLLGCPRLRTCLFAGSGASGLYLPVGAKLNNVSYPNNATTVFMHSLPFLQESGLTLPTLAGIVNLYINNCANLNPLSIAEDVLETTGNTLAYATLIWNGIIQGNAATLKTLATLAGRVTFENNTPGTEAGMPDVEGTAQISGMYSDDVDALQLVNPEDYGTGLKKALSNLFGTSLYIIYDPTSIYIRFVDPEVLRVLLANNIGDGVGVTLQVAASTGIGTMFQSNTTMTSFDEYKYFKPDDGLLARSFAGCTALKSITMPAGFPYKEGVFNGCSNLEELTLLGDRGVSSYSFAGYSFVGCTKLTRVNVPSETVYMMRGFGPNQAAVAWGPFDASQNGHIYINGVEVTHFVIPNGTTSIQQGQFKNVKGVVEMTIPSSLSSTEQASFFNCSNLAKINITDMASYLGISWNGTQGYPFVSRSEGGTLWLNGTQVTSLTVPSSITAINSYAFYRVQGLTTLTLPSSVTAIWNYSFYQTSITSVTFPSSITRIGNSAFYGCNNLTELTVPSTVTTLGDLAFSVCNGLVNCSMPGGTLSDSHALLNSGNGTGTLTYNGTITAGADYLLPNFKIIVINGDLAMGARLLSNKTAWQMLKVYGNVTGNSTGGLVWVANNNLKFIKVTGTVGTRLFYTGANGLASGTIIHLAYTGGTIAGTAASVMNGNSSVTAKISKVYVGDGSSQAADEAVLALYTADSDWAAYSSKLDIWYNYIHGADPDPDFIN